MSPTYAGEIRTPELGMGLDGLLRTRAPVLSGILNGIDYRAWNPAEDTQITQPYDSETFSLKAENKLALQREFGLPRNEEALVFGGSTLTTTDIAVAAGMADIGDRARVGLVGPNGAGKSSLFKAITGEVIPDAGTVARARGLTSTVTFPQGNLAPEGSVVKSTAIDPSVLDADGEFLTGVTTSPYRFSDEATLPMLVTRKLDFAGSVGHSRGAHIEALSSWVNLASEGARRA